MARIVLVRHGQAEAAWGMHPDPGLSPAGRTQAAAVAEALVPLGPLPVVTSPLRRCQETARPLAGRWGVEPTIDPAVGEVASPAGVGLDGRSAWLAEAMAGSWRALPPEVRRWRSGVVEALVALARRGDAVVFSHYVAINAAVGYALGDERVRVFQPDNCSRTVLDVVGDRLTIVELGSQGDTVVV